MQQQGYQSYNVISCILYPRLLRSKLLVTRISFSNLFIGFSAWWGEQAGLHQTNIIAFDLSTTSAINVSPDLRDLYPINNQRLSKTTIIGLLPYCSYWPHWSDCIGCAMFDLMAVLSAD